jgi:CheY-like chemotaxis protein
MFLGKKMSKLLHVLVVEDTVIAQFVTKSHLTQLGCVVDTASDGLIALDKSNNVVYDVILMDLGLGDGPDGFEVTTLIKQQSKLNQHTPVMALTIHSESQFNEKAQSVGIERFIYKPFRLADATEIVDYLTNKTS